MTERLLKSSFRATLGAVGVLLLVAGCQSEGHHRAGVQTPPVLAFSAPVAAPLDRSSLRKHAIAAQTERPLAKRPETEGSLHGITLSKSSQADRPRRFPVVQASAMEAAENQYGVLRVPEMGFEPAVKSEKAPAPEALPAPRPLLAPEHLPAPLSLSLQDAIATSLFQNPDLTTLRAQEGVNQGMLGVAATYPWNPFVQAQLLPRGTPFDPGTGPGSGSGKTNYYVWVMQRFELAHQRRYRKQSAAAALNQTRWNIQQGELLNVAQTARLYFTALYQRDVWNLSREAARLNTELLGVVERRFKAGLATAAEVTTAKVAARQSDRQAHLAEATYQVANLALHQQLNVSIAEPLELSGRLADFQWLPICSLEPYGLEPQETAQAAPTGQHEKFEPNELYAGLAEELAAGRPDVMAACAGVMVAQANRRLAQAAMIPDIQTGPIYDTGDDGTRFLGLRVQMDLPVFNTGAPLARQRQAEQTQQIVTLQQLRMRATREAEVAINRYERARLLAKESKVDMSPFSESMPPEFKEINAQFQAGQADVLAVFATQGSLLQVRRTYLDLLNELAQSAAGVIQATALPVERVVISDDGQCRP